MLSLFFTSFLLVTLINKIKSSDPNITSITSINLLLINGTSSQCVINSTQNQQGIGLCLNDQYNYRCYNNIIIGNSSSNSKSKTGGNGNNNNIINNNNNTRAYNETLLGCNLVNNASQCYNVFISKNNNNNFTLNCFYRHLNVSVSGSEFRLESDNECLYGIYGGDNQNNTVLVCTTFAPVLILPTTTSNVITTKNQNQNQNQHQQYYKFKILGVKVSKHGIKVYGIVILIAIIIAACLCGLCCYGSCYLCCNMKNKDRDNTNNNNCMCCKKNENRMPQSSCNTANV